MSNVCIIGCGISGLIILNKLKKNTSKIMVFEKMNQPGGVWSINKYENLRAQLHSRHYKIPNFNWSTDIDRPTAKQIVEYLNSFIIQNNLKRFIHFNTKVNSVIYKRNKYQVEVINNNQFKKYSFDYVIQTGHSTIPLVPRVKKIIPHWHSSQMTDKHFDAIVADNKKVTVIGGSKSAYEMVFSFAKRGYKVNWLARTIYSVAEYTSYTTVNLNNATRAFFYKLFNNKISFKEAAERHIFVYTPNNCCNQNPSKSGNLILLKDLKLIESYCHPIEYKQIEYQGNTIKILTKFNDQEVNIETDLIIFATGYHKHKAITNQLTDQYILINSSIEYLNASIPISADGYASAIRDFIFYNYQNKSQQDFIYSRIKYYQRYTHWIYLFSTSNLDHDQLITKIKYIKIIVLLILLIVIFYRLKIRV